MYKIYPFIYSLILSFFFVIQATGATLDEQLPIRGLCLQAPQKQRIDDFIKFIDDVLAPGKINTLILRVDFGFEYTSYPELRGGNPLSKDDVKKLLDVCRKHNINLIPHLQLLGHQSWAKNTGKLLQVYPEFDETPHVSTQNYSGWPNPDGLYCKSYCPLHPEVHKVVYSLVDELMDAFEATDFHGGMDEVFYIANEKCPRCAGKNPAELFAGEVNKAQKHLAEKNRRLWIWGDRLIDGRETGLGEWEGATNGTAPAIDLISKDVFICDWHYERADLTSVLFAAKGLNVASCPWKKPQAAAEQIADMVRFRKQAGRKMGSKFQGVIQTAWGGCEGFVRSYDNLTPEQENQVSEAACFKRVLAEIAKLPDSSTTAQSKDTAKVKTITVKDAYEKLKDKFAVLIDVRNPDEYAEVHAEGAILIPLDSSEFTTKVQEIAEKAGKDVPVYFICRSGRRSEKACESMINAGFTNVVNIEGGTLEWVKQNLPN